VLCTFRTFCNSWKSGLYTHTVLVVAVGPYTFERRIHKVAVELSNTVVGVQLCTLFLLQSCLTDGTVNKTSSIAPTVRWYYDLMIFIFQFAFLQLQGFSASTSPRNRACVTRPSSLVGAVWARDQYETSNATLS